MEMMDLITGGISFVLTLMVLSYWVGDNPLFRVAVYMFVGVSAGYAALVAWYQVLYPRLIIPIITGGTSAIAGYAVPLILCVLILFKVIPSMARLGNPAVAFLVGTGAAVAISGAVLGTLFPLTLDSINLLAPASPGAASALEKVFEGSIILVGTVSTLAYFQFSASKKSGRRNIIVNILAQVGQIFIGITFGVLFAGVYAAAVTALIERISFLINFLFPL